ncbi:MAG: tRNA-dihydrouridine synthase [Proteobacteria bacterium]|nr:tRNA-dihydrouridine synthase [Pseudomonadota bacterium]
MAKTKVTTDILAKLFSTTPPVMLAPLAGVSDYPFRRVCREQGADLVYVEMLSAVALSYHSKNTMRMIHRHHEEDILGAQITGRSPEEIAKGIQVLEHYPLDTIDINMGCPVKKVVKTGCGSALLKDPELVYQVVKAACAHTDKTLSVKIRRGWSTEQAYPMEVADACEQAGAAWLTVHGRLRSDSYAEPVNLDDIKRIKQRLSIPVIGNGNLFDHRDLNYMKETTHVDGWMISRGALGNPWVFKMAKKGGQYAISLSEWHRVVQSHIRLVCQHYGNRKLPAVRFRKHLLWYLKGWPVSAESKHQAQSITTMSQARDMIDDLVASWQKLGVTFRRPMAVSHGKWTYQNHLVSYKPASQEEGTIWDPKYEMDRRLDRGVGHDRMVAS